MKIGGLSMDDAFRQSMIRAGPVDRGATMNNIYPVNDYGPLMPGLVMATVAIFHVFLAQFAVGG
jgi:hypothetical protein